MKSLNVRDSRGSFCLAEDMPELVEANVEVGYEKIDRLLESLTSVKRLSICLTKCNVIFFSALNILCFFFNHTYKEFNCFL